VVERAAPERTRAVLAAAALTTGAPLLQGFDALAVADDPTFTALQRLEVARVAAVPAHGRKVELGKRVEIGTRAGRGRYRGDPGDVRQRCCHDSCGQKVNN
jgi:hypothetical protein